MNFLTALIAVAGAVVGTFLVSWIGPINPMLLAFAAGGFIYIGASDLVPELHKEPKIRKSLMAFAFFIMGVVMMLVMKILLA
jgi:zinc and cadmium transporter